MDDFLPQDNSLQLIPLEVLQSYFGVLFHPLYFSVYLPSQKNCEFWLIVHLQFELIQNEEELPLESQKQIDLLTS